MFHHFATEHCRWNIYLFHPPEGLLGIFYSLFLSNPTHWMVSGLPVVHLAALIRFLLLLQRSVVPPLSLDNVPE